MTLQGFFVFHFAAFSLVRHAISLHRVATILARVRRTYEYQAKPTYQESSFNVTAGVTTRNRSQPYVTIKAALP